jgi:hypothetical protein
MFDVRKFRPRTRLHYLVLFLLALSILGTAQDKDKDKSKGKEEKESKKAEASGGGNFVKVEGKVRCDKPDPSYSIEVPDRSGHALVLAKRKCTWTEPMAIMGAKTKDGVAVSFTEKMEATLHVHSFEVDTLDNGEKLTMQSQGQVLADKGPVSTKGRWSYMRGTGKFKGIKGGGTYEGKLEADDVLTLDLEGVYDPTDMGGEKK